MKYKQNKEKHNIQYIKQMEEKCALRIILFSFLILLFINLLFCLMIITRSVVSSFYVIR